MITVNVDYLQQTFTVFVYAASFGFFAGTALHLLSFGIFKALRLVNIKL